MAGVLLGLLLIFVLFQGLRRAAGRLASDFFYPFVSSSAKVENSAAMQRLLLENRFSLASQVESLRQENLLLNSKIDSLEGLEKENFELRRLAALPKRQGYKTIYAELILRDPAFWEERFIINKGRKEGIHPGALVISWTRVAGAERPVPVVAGRVRNTDKHSAEVITILNNECNLSVRLGTSQAAGIMQGATRTIDGSALRVKYLPVNKDYVTGEEVYTSGLNPDMTAPGILAGYLSGDKNHPARIHDNIYMSVPLTPAANLENIRFVIVLVRDTAK